MSTCAGCPTSGLQSLPWTLVVQVDPRKKLKLRAWINVAAQRLGAKLEDSVGVKTVVPVAIWHPRQHQHLDVCRGMAAAENHSRLQITEHRESDFPPCKFAGGHRSSIVCSVTRSQHSCSQQRFLHLTVGGRRCAKLWFKRHQLNFIC